MKTIQYIQHQNCRSHRFGWLVGVREGVAPYWIKLALRRNLKNLHA